MPLATALATAGYRGCLRSGSQPVNDVSSTLHDSGLDMATQKPFPQARYLARLQRFDESTDPSTDDMSLLAGTLHVTGERGRQGLLVSQLIQLLKTRQAVLQAAFAIKQVADELRRCQKFARPGQPSAALVRLRQQQASVRHASSVARQHFVQAAAAFVRVASIEVPSRLSPEAFIVHWIDLNVPTDTAPAS